MRVWAYGSSRSRPSTGLHVLCSLGQEGARQDREWKLGQGFQPPPSIQAQGLGFRGLGLGLT